MEGVLSHSLNTMCIMIYKVAYMNIYIERERETDEFFKQKQIFGNLVNSTSLNK